MWQVKYSPKSLDGFIGKAAAEKAGTWDGRPVIIHGACGTGKTSLAYLMAAKRGWDVVEVGDENIVQAENIGNTAALFGNRRMLLLENVDSVKDIKAVGELVEKAKNPLVLTTDDFSNKRLATVKKKCLEIQVRRPLPASIVKHLQMICDKEGVVVEKAVLERIAKGSSGDIRAAINDLETLATGRGKLVEADIGNILPERDRESDIYKALSTIFGGREFEKVVGSTWDLNEQPKDIIWWVEENTPRLYHDKQSINDAYHSLSRADVFLGRITNRQYWGFLRYVNVLMTAGVNSSRPAKINFTQYMFPGYFAAMGRSKGGRNLEASISGKIGPRLHVSSRVFRREYLPLYRLLLKKKRVDAEELRQEFKLEDEEIEYLTG